MVSAARRQIIGGGAPINKSRRRRRPQIVGGGVAPAHGSNWKPEQLITKIVRNGIELPLSQDQAGAERRTDCSL